MSGRPRGESSPVVLFTSRGTHRDALVLIHLPLLREIPSALHLHLPAKIESPSQSLKTEVVRLRPLAFSWQAGQHESRAPSETPALGRLRAFPNTTHQNTPQHRALFCRPQSSLIITSPERPFRHLRRTFFAFWAS